MFVITIGKDGKVRLLKTWQEKPDFREFLIPIAKRKRGYYWIYLPFFNSLLLGLILAPFME
jgi:hypothetical protein